MSEDHKPELPGEAARIKAGGGHIAIMPGGARVNGDLNLSRALGDFRHKQQENVSPEKQIVTASPEVRECTLDAETQLLVLGCDGIWERNTNQKLMERLHNRLVGDHTNGRPLLSTLGAEVCDSSLCPSMSIGDNPTFDGSGCDNMTILLVEFDELSADAAKPAIAACESIPVSTLVAEVLEVAAEADADSESKAAEHGVPAVAADNAPSSAGTPTKAAEVMIAAESTTTDVVLGELILGDAAASGASEEAVDDSADEGGASDDDSGEPCGKRRRLKA